jgi:hypothetical protein
VAKHFIASFLSGDPASIAAIEKALRGSELTIADIQHCAEEIKDRASEHEDEYAIKIFTSGSSASELVTYATTQYIIDRIDDQGVTGRSINKDGSDHYEGEDEDKDEDLDLTGDNDGDS